MKSGNNLVVAVWMVTYNQQDYIGQAIEGVISQNVNFKIKLLIGEDCSSDNTRNICLQYETKYPDLIELIFTTSNNMNQNSSNVFSACINSGAKYIAMCEGDDYWTDPDKLQKQVDFLETNADIGGCFHDVVVVDENNKIIKENYHESHQKMYNQIESLTHGGNYATCSLVFRSLVMKNLPNWFIKAPSDYTIDLLVTEFGDIAHINETMGAYRIHAGGIWQGSKEHINQASLVIRYLACLENPKFKNHYGNFFYKRISETSFSLSLYYQTEINFIKSIKYAARYFIYTRPKNIKFFSDFFKDLLFPAFYIKFKYLVKRLLQRRPFVITL